MSVILIDGKGALYRHGYALRNLSNSEGEFTGALHGFTSGLLRLRRKFKDSKLIVVWDGERTSQSWRKALYPDYKGNRVGKQKDDPIRKGILSQEKPLREIIEALGLVQISHEFVEADDIIGILSRRIKDSIVYSADRDFIQLMTDGVRVVRDVHKDEKVTLAFHTEDKIKEEFRCAACNVLYVRAIAGDSSDNLPGAIKGVGVVGAARMIEQGVNPSLSGWSKHSLNVRQMFPMLQSVWLTIHRNYLLMRLPKEPSQTIFGEASAQLKRKLDETVRQIETDFPCDDRALLRLLSRYELNDLISRRHELRLLHAV